MRPSSVLGTLLLLGGGFLGVAVVGAQSPRDLAVDEWVTLALASNPELRAARAELDAAAARVQQAGLRPNPMLELGGQKAVSPDNNLNVGLTLPLDLNGRKEGRVGVAEREVEVRRAQIAERERRLRADVQMKAGEAMAARRTLGVTDELVRANRQALTLVEARVRQGAAPTLDENLMRVEVNRLEAGRLMQASRIDVAILQLKALAGTPPDDPLDIRGDLSSPPPVPAVADALGRGVEQRPDVRAARAEVAVAQAKMRKEQAEGRWDASVNVGYQRQDFGFNLKGLTDSGSTRQIQDVFHYFGAGLTITLPVRNRNEGNVAAANAEMTAAERRREFSELIARQEVAAALAQYEAARRTVELYERGVRGVARANVDVVRQSYGLGRATLLDVIAEQRRYIEVENGYTDVLRQAWDAGVDVERAIGGPSPMTRSDLRRAAAVAVVVGISAVGGFVWGDRRAARPAATSRLPQAASAPASMPPAPGSSTEEPVEVSLTPEAIARAGIKTAIVRGRAVAASITVPGTVTSNAYRDTRATALVGGIVRSVNVELGSMVARGQALAVVVSTELADAQMKYLSGQAMLAADHQKLARTEKLVVLGAASRQELEEITAVHEAHETEVAASRQRLLLLGLSPQRVTALRSADEIVSEVVVPAPGGGTVVARAVNPGQVVSAGQELFVVADLSTVWVIGDLYEKDFAGVRPGAEAVVSVAGIPPIRGRVAYIDPRVDPAARTAKVRVEVPNPAGALRLGMFVSVNFTVPATARGVAVVPRAAIQAIGSRSVVYVAADDEGRFIERAVSVGARAGDSVEVVEGLKPGERVVSEGSFFLRAEAARTRSGS